MLKTAFPWISHLCANEGLHFFFVVVQSGMDKNTVVVLLLLWEKF